METNTMDLNKKSKGIPASVLKWIAIITMFIDHFAAGIIEVGVISKITDYSNILTNKYYILDMVLRSIGRIAFPIFVFLIVEGFFLTSNRKKMSIRLFIFALLSEIPFDLGLNNVFIEYNHQNIYFTLLLGFLAMWIAESIKERLKDKGIACYIVQGLVFILFMFLNTMIRTDYGAMGIFVIAVFYFLRGGNPLRRVIATLVGFSFEAGMGFMRLLGLPFEIPMVYLSAIPIYYYNGERGRQNKYFFYLFYPLHLILIYFIRVYIFKF